MKTEVNGPANIIMFINFALEEGKIDKDLAEKLIKHAESTIKYIRLLDNPKNIQWSEVVSDTVK